MKFIDLTGQRFGKLIAIEKSNNKGKKIVWKCLCDCGEFHYVTTSNLRSGHIKHCSNCEKERFNRRKDYTGKKYNKLTIIEMLWNYNGQRRTYCRALCDCGKEIITNVEKVTSGHTKSCGCYNIESIIKRNSTNIDGQKFGKLLVIATMPKYNSNRSFCRCKCECGNETIAAKSDIVSGHTKSCGCLNNKGNENRATDYSGIITEYGVKFISPAYHNDIQWLWECECGICKNHFIATPSNVLNGHYASCGCAKTPSKERFIEKFLIDNRVKFKKQYTFPDCKYKQKLKFDFALFKENRLYCLIEYDGRQHTMPISFLGGEKEFNLTLIRDKIKNNYCLKNNLKLYRLSYKLSDKEIKKNILEIIN
jgi:hypothetical protein